jgi:hypothetical protein
VRALKGIGVKDVWVMGRKCEKWKGIEVDEVVVGGVLPRKTAFFLVEIGVCDDFEC